jgi:hypothetical protein
LPASVSIEIMPCASINTSSASYSGLDRTVSGLSQVFCRPGRTGSVKITIIDIHEPEEDVYLIVRWD